MADTYTSNYNLTKVEEGSTGWAGKANGNMDSIDIALKTINDYFSGGNLILGSGSNIFSLGKNTDNDLLIKHTTANDTSPNSIKQGVSLQHGTGFLCIGQGGRGLPDSPLTIYSDKVGTRPGINVVHKNTGLTRESGLYFQNLDTPSTDVGTSIAFYGQTPSPDFTDIQHGLLAFSQEGASTTKAKYEVFLRSNDESLPVICSHGTTAKGYAYTMFGPTGAAFAGSYLYGAYTPGAIVHVASDFNDQSDGVMIERRRTPNPNRYVFRVDSNGTLLIENRDVASSGIYVTSGAVFGFYGSSSTGANTATLTNSPTAGNPTGWVTVSINGNNRKIPYW